MSDDDTPVRRPRRSSVTVATADLLVERIASRLSVSPLPAEVRGDVVAWVVDWCAHRTRLALDTERREHDRTRLDLRAAEEQLDAAHHELVLARRLAVRHE